MKCIIAGSRTAERQHVEFAITHSGWRDRITEVVCGMAAGADQHGKFWALMSQPRIKVSEFPANWSQHKKAAGPIRNRQMARYADAAIVVWNGSSKGSQNMIEEMRKLLKPCFVWDYSRNHAQWYEETALQ